MNVAAIFLLAGVFGMSMHQNVVRPKVAANVKAFVAVPFPSPLPAEVGNLVFTPDGTAYFTDGNNEIASFTQAGVYKRISVPHALNSTTLLYARGNLWMAADTGIVKVDPDGGGRRWYPLPVPGSSSTDVLAGGITLGPDGSIYVIALLFFPDGGLKTELFRIDVHGVVTQKTIPKILATGNGCFVFGADKLLYFGYYTSTGTYGVARVERNGGLSLFPISNGDGSLNSFVVSNGSVYFTNTLEDLGSFSDVVSLGRITPAGVISFTPFPPTVNDPQASYLTVDKGGNLWATIGSEPDGIILNNVLYQFDVYTGRFYGPYSSGVSIGFYGAPVVAPDNDVWIVLPGPLGAYNTLPPAGMGIFIRH